ncbi:bifunctional nuclease family protein [Corynebacterium sp. H128]|uniref:bifunctional nuclease family protein n=1 Tax=unclassified Corynebacterium TaxID=2624378 RepID=UPI00309F233B
MAFLPVEFGGVTPIGPEMFPCVLLQWLDRGLVLPMWIAAAVADELDIRDSGMSPRRPNAYDLLVDAYQQQGGGVSEIRIVSQHQGVFIASIVLLNGDEVDARASDALVIARIVQAPVLVDEDVLNQTSLFVSAPDLASYFDLVMEAPEVGEESSFGDAQADADFEELMRSLGVSEDDLLGDE